MSGVGANHNADGKVVYRTVTNFETDSRPVRAVMTNSVRDPTRRECQHEVVKSIRWALAPTT